MADEKKQTSNGNITITVTCSSFPFQLFKEWEQDCKARFNDCRWMKMWHDHLMAQQFYALSKFLAAISQQFDIEAAEEKSEEQEPKKINVIGGEIRE